MDFPLSLRVEAGVGAWFGLRGWAWGRVLAILVPVLALISCPASVSAQSGDERFELYTGCREVRLFVGGHLAGDGWGYPASLETAVRSRLRSARIYAENNADDPSLPKLSIIHTATAMYDARETNLVGVHFTVATRLEKMVRDPAAEIEGYATTWQGIGRVGWGPEPDGNRLLRFISEATDEFIDNYLRVNAAACRG